MKRALITLLAAASAFAAEPEFPLTADSKPQPGIAKGTMIKGTHIAKDGSVFPGTVREYQMYLPATFDKTKPAPFMVFQDGVIYQAPVVFDNLIAKKDIPPLVGLFIKPGVVPAANDNALPRFNRSYEYDSVTDTYSRFLIEEFLPAIEAEHGIQFSTDPNHAAIAGNSSGGICAFMAAWHRPDRFRRVFTGVGTYVGIRGADRLPVLVRKIEPKPLRVFLQSGTGDNDLYCGDWWMANQMMQRSLAWAGYDVNHAWGEGGHNQKHASQVFPDAMRWLWRDWQTDIEVKANPKGESKWKGYEVVGEGKWDEMLDEDVKHHADRLSSMNDGTVFLASREMFVTDIMSVDTLGKFRRRPIPSDQIKCLTACGDNLVVLSEFPRAEMITFTPSNDLTEIARKPCDSGYTDLVAEYSGSLIVAKDMLDPFGHPLGELVDGEFKEWRLVSALGKQAMIDITLSPDQTQLYWVIPGHPDIYSIIRSKDGVHAAQFFGQLETFGSESGELVGLCVDTNGWLYVATSIGIQVCDQAGRVNFIIHTPKPAADLCFGGKDLSELFIACGDTIYKRPTKAKGVVSGQQAPIKPAPPKL